MSAKSNAAGSIGSATLSPVRPFASVQSLLLLPLPSSLLFGSHMCFCFVPSSRSRKLNSSGLGGLGFVFPWHGMLSMASKGLMFLSLVSCLTESQRRSVARPVLRWNQYLTMYKPRSILPLLLLSFSLSLWFAAYTRSLCVVLIIRASAALSQWPQTTLPLYFGFAPPRPWNLLARSVWDLPPECDARRICSM
jgi:hypothetical protein